ncbi:MAG: hypothetical protein N3A01_05495 [Bacteroidales bacterium]|nr:hypothetical protein [Bacteroidales bacterium]
MNNFNENYKTSITFHYDTGIIFSLIITLVYVLLSLFIYLLFFKTLHSFIKSISYIIENPVIFILFVYVGIICQEFVKSLLLRIVANVKFKEQKIGFNVNSLMPYVESKYPINIMAYFSLLVLPNILILVIFILALILNNTLLIILTYVWVFFSGYDILTLMKLKKYWKKNYLVSENSSMPGVNLYENPFNI